MTEKGKNTKEEKNTKAVAFFSNWFNIFLIALSFIGIGFGAGRYLKSENHEREMAKMERMLDQKKDSIKVYITQKSNCFGLNEKLTADIVSLKNESPRNKNFSSISNPHKVKLNIKEFPTTQNLTLKNSLANSPQATNTNNAASFIPPIFPEGYIKLISFDKANKAWYGESFITNVVSEIEIENLKGQITVTKTALLYKNAPNSFNQDYNFNPKDVEIIESNRLFFIIEPIFKIEESNIIQYWCKVRKP